MPFLIANWKPVAIVGAIIAVFLGGTHYQRLIDREAAQTLQIEQQAANAKAQAELEKKAKVAELELAAERTKSAEAEANWENERHAKNHVACTLSAGTIGLLKSASSK